MEERKDNQEVPAQESGQDKDGAQIAWLSYLGLLIIVPILISPDKEYVKFHIRQGLAILLLEAGWVFLAIVLNFLPIIKYVVGVLNFFVWIGFLILSIMGILNAVQGKMQKLPVVGDIGEQLNIIK